jgi:heme-degrading monooxygenase HmoA
LIWAQDQHSFLSRTDCERPYKQRRSRVLEESVVMIVTVFRSRLNAGVQEEYDPVAKQMSELARTMPGYVSHKGFTAADGERVTIVEFESEEALRAWRIHPDHAKAKKRGIESFFSEYKFQICSVLKEREWTPRAQATRQCP